MRTVSPSAKSVLTERPNPPNTSTRFRHLQLPPCGIVMEVSQSARPLLSHGISPSEAPVVASTSSMLLVAPRGADPRVSTLTFSTMSGSTELVATTLQVLTRTLVSPTFGVESSTMPSSIASADPTVSETIWNGFPHRGVSKPITRAVVETDFSPISKVRPEAAPFAANGRAKNLVCVLALRSYPGMKRTRASSSALNFATPRMNPFSSTIWMVWIS